MGQPLTVDETALLAAADYHEVLDMLGPPHRLSAAGSGMVFLYEEIDLLERQVGLNLSWNNISLFKAVAGRSVADRRLLLVSFDAAGRTRAVDYQQRSEAAASGAAFQFVFAVAGVVDDEHLTAAPGFHDWGMGLLEGDLPALLNQGSQPDAGTTGVEQKGSPTTVGQRTLGLHR